MPYYQRKSDTTAGLAMQAWRLVKEVGGPAVVIAAIFFAARIDSNILATVKAIDKLSAVVDALGKDQNALSVELARQATTIVESQRRISELEEARHGRR
jgi:hypothetical protein